MQPVKLSLAEQRLVSFHTKIPIPKLPTVYLADGDMVNDRGGYERLASFNAGAVYRKDGVMFVYITDSSSASKWTLVTVAILIADEETVDSTTYRAFVDTNIKLADKASSIRYYMESYQNEFKELFINNRNTINIESFTSYIKRLAKVKIPFTVETIRGNRALKFTFKKVKVGNSVEGYVQYKAIDLWLKPYSFDFVDAQYHFKNFSVKQSEYLPIAFHPHIKDWICYGNMKKDFETYISNGFYEFALALIKESVYNYSSERPFVNVIILAKNIKNCEKLWKAELSQSDNFNAINRSCPSCGTQILVNDANEDECSGSRCRGNLHAHIYCAICGESMTLVEPHVRDLTRSHLYQWTCTCSVTCPYCGTQHTRGRDCTNSTCIYNKNARFSCWARSRRRRTGGSQCDTYMLTIGEKSSTGAYIWYCPVHDTKTLKAKIALPEFETYSVSVIRRFRDNNIS